VYWKYSVMNWDMIYSTTGLLCCDVLTMIISDMIRVNVYLRDILCGILCTTCLFTYGYVNKLNIKDRRKCLFRGSFVLLYNPLVIYLTWIYGITVYQEIPLSLFGNIVRTGISMTMRSLFYRIYFKMPMWFRTVNIKTHTLLISLYISYFLYYSLTYKVGSHTSVPPWVYLTHWQMFFFIVAHTISFIVYCTDMSTTSILHNYFQVLVTSIRAFTCSVFFGFWHLVLPSTFLYDDHNFWGYRPHNWEEMLLVLGTMIFYHGPPMFITLTWGKTIIIDTHHHLRRTRILGLLVSGGYMLQLIFQGLFTGFQPYPGSGLTWNMIYSSLYIICVQFMFVDIITKQP
jgi:hypothetical protein